MTEDRDAYNYYKRKEPLALMRPYTEDVDMSEVSVSEADRANGSPKEGDMIAMNPDNHDDKWLVSEEYFKDNFHTEPISPETPA